MKELHKFKQSEFRTCSATIRPEYCFHASNICCFNCENNRKCTAIAKQNSGIQPCKVTMPVTVDNKKVRVELFSETDVCEFAI